LGKFEHILGLKEGVCPFFTPAQELRCRVKPEQQGFTRLRALWRRSKGWAHFVVSTIIRYNM